MAKHVNKVILLGNVGKDPEVKFLPSGAAVANFSIATSDRYKDKAGEWQERTEWHNVAAFARTANRTHSQIEIPPAPPKQENARSPHPNRYH